MIINSHNESFEIGQKLVGIKKGINGNFGKVYKKFKNNDWRLEDGSGFSITDYNILEDRRFGLLNIFIEKNLMIESNTVFEIDGFTWKDVTNYTVYSEIIPTKFEAVLDYPNNINIVIDCNHPEFTGGWVFHCESLNFHTVPLETITAIETAKEAIEYCKNYLEHLNKVFNLNIKERPSPFKWLKEEKFKIPQGATYISPEISMTQCAGWIAEYVDKYYKL
jgi:hypothetical protein